MNINRLFKGNRTRIVNTAIGAVGAVSVLGELGSVPELKQIIPPNWWPYCVVAIAVINIALRQITTTPPGKKF